MPILRPCSAAFSRTLLLALVASASAFSALGARDGESTIGAGVVMLGTGTPNADPERSGPAVAVIAGERALLVDAGPGVVRRAAAAEARGVTQLASPNLDRLFLTHLHSDHTLGLPDLIFSPWVLERQRPLEIWGPPGTARMVEHIQAAWQEDVHMRLFGLEPANRSGYRTVVHEVEGAGVVLDTPEVKVEAIEVAHGSWPLALGYKFTVPPPGGDGRTKTIVISGDTAVSEALIEAAKGCDLLFHEAYSVAGFSRRNAVWQRYHAANHTSTHQVGEIARRAEPRRLVLYHQLYWGEDDAQMVLEVKERWNGQVSTARDLEVYE